MVMSPKAIVSPIWKTPYLMSTSKISSSPSNEPSCARICANAPESSPRKYNPSRISLDLAAAGFVLVTSPVESVLNPLVNNKNRGRSASTTGTEVNPLPWSVTVIAMIFPPTTSAVPKAPAPPPPVIRTDTKLYPDCNAILAGSI